MGGLYAQDTTKTYWKNGKLMSIGVKKKGTEQGHWIYYHNNGAKWTEGDYQDGKKVGIWKVWYDNGKLGQEYHADNGPFKSWFQSGKVESEGQFKNGQRDGEWTFYHPNGQLYKQVIYIGDSVHGHVIEYYDNGDKLFEGTYDMGLLEGEACWWNRGGKKDYGNSTMRRAVWAARDILSKVCRMVCGPIITRMEVFGAKVIM